MDLQGKVIAVVPPRNGVSARGEWVAQDFVIETHDTFPRKMVFSVFGADRLQRFNIQLGQEVMVSFDIDAHEYNGRWFNSIRAFDVRPFDPTQQPVPPYVAQPGGQQPPFAQQAPFPNSAPAPFPNNAPAPFPNNAPAPAAPQTAAPQPAAPAPTPADAPAAGDSTDDLPF